MRSGSEILDGWAVEPRGVGRFCPESYYSADDERLRESPPFLPSSTFNTMGTMGASQPQSDSD